MTINIDSSLFNAEQIKNIEKTKKCKYVMESCLPASGGGWADKPVAIFYQAEAHPQGSNYFGLYYQERSLWITNAIKAREPFGAIKLPNGDIYFSRHHHDYRTLPGNYMVDGGREYLRYGGPSMDGIMQVKLAIVKDHLEDVTDRLNDDGTITDPTNGGKVYFNLQPIRFTALLDGDDHIMVP